MTHSFPTRRSADLVTPGTRDGEFAILGSRYVAGMGLGRHLMRRLVRWARGRKLERMYGDVLESNQPMLSLADSLGFRREASDTPGLVREVMELAQAAGSQAGTGDGGRAGSPGSGGARGGAWQGGSETD